ncbi:MAG: VOC family protein [Alphaproteobacteria bacterium]
MVENKSCAVRGINHITLAVVDLDRAVEFYTAVLGLSLRKHWPGGAYLEAGETWICLSLDPNAAHAPPIDYSHVAFDIDAAQFAPLCRAITASGATSWRDNASEGASFYFLDPDNHRLEIHVGTLATRLAAMADQAS